jgi:hypothetical protein
LLSQPSTKHSPVVSGPGVCPSSLFPLRSATRRWPRRLLWLSVLCFVFHTPLLTALANAWIVNEPLEKADAIVVLGGGLETRPFAAAALYQLSTNNYPHCKVLLTQPEVPPTARMGLTVPEFVIARQVLLSNGMPATAIQMIGTNVTSTHGLQPCLAPTSPVSGDGSALPAAIDGPGLSCAAGWSWRGARGGSGVDGAGHWLADIWTGAPGFGCEDLSSDL